MEDIALLEDAMVLNVSFVKNAFPNRKKQIKNKNLS